MKLLKEKYDGLQDIDNLSLGLKNFLSKPDVQQALQKSDFDAIYRKIPTDFASKFTQLVNSLDINPLNYLDYIPNWFLANTTIKSITIPSNINKIGNYAFDSCASLTHITIPNSVISIDSGAFYNCRGLTSITIPDKIINIDYATFLGCNQLTSITIPNSVTNIGSWAFAYCENLTSITIPSNVTNIGENAFRGCIGLTSITIPDSVISIGDDVFTDCENLKTITYKGTKANWNKIQKEEDQYIGPSIQTIHCTDGDINYKVV